MKTRFFKITKDLSKTTLLVVTKKSENEVNDINTNKGSGFNTEKRQNNNLTKSVIKNSDINTLTNNYKFNHRLFTTFNKKSLFHTSISNKEDVMQHTQNKTLVKLFSSSYSAVNDIINNTRLC